MPRLWILSPSYRDVPSFQVLRRRVLEVVAADPQLREWSTRFVLVDDTAGSDPEVDELRPHGDVSVVRPPFNVGHQRAIVLGVRALAPDLHDDDVVVTLDADGQDRPEDLPRLLGPVLAAPPSQGVVALARRTERPESPLFKLGYVAFRLLFRALTGTVIRSGNFAAYRGTLARRLLRHPYFDLCYSSTFIALGTPIRYVPCPRGPRYDGTSRMNSWTLVLHGLRMLMPFLDRIAVRALALFAAAFGGGVLLLATIAGIKLFTDRAIPGWATSTALAAITLSMIALSSFLILFATFSQSRGVSLSTLEGEHERVPGEPPPSPDDRG